MVIPVGDAAIFRQARVDPVGAAVMLVMKGRGTPAHRALLLWVAILYALFSMCATKMPAYMMVAAPAIFLLQADFWLRLRERQAAAVTRGRRAVLAACLFVLALLPARYLLGPTGPLEHRDRNPEWPAAARTEPADRLAPRRHLQRACAHRSDVLHAICGVHFPATAAHADDLRRRGYDV